MKRSRPPTVFSNKLFGSETHYIAENYAEE
jgi:hypothetical protein